MTLLVKQLVDGKLRGFDVVVEVTAALLHKLEVIRAILVVDGRHHVIAFVILKLTLVLC